MKITTLGIDLAKNVFQLHGVDERGKAVLRRQLRREQIVAFFVNLAPCLVGMEACATGHYWARELMKLGHLVRLMPAKDVKAYVKRNKNDAADAEAICEAVRRPKMIGMMQRLSARQSDGPRCALFRRSLPNSWPSKPSIGYASVWCEPGRSS